ncbi:uncharacterized protein LOC131151958 [Malania oleifera]|uniref:uncharacterized protein LOC131151958 n=1 Tax=Malania oleifera TaxID=397392 RepID=UPI0025AEA393|nr:uncharacterized protein LOC131151958 [Malania oleifera]
MELATGGSGTTGSTAARKVMVVADPTRESAAALQWTLSHALMERDELILLHVENPASWKNTFSTFLTRRPVNPRGPTVAIHSPSSSGSSTTTVTATPTPTPNANAAAINVAAEGGGDNSGYFLEEMKNACEAAQPKARVHVERVEMGSQDKAATILFQSAALSVDLLVIGQRRTFSTALLGNMLTGGSTRSGTTKGLDTAEFLIENSMCTCVGVQKKGQNAGYLLSTKTQKNFWLLA